MTVLFGYTTVSGVTPCPCGDPGTYMCMETTDEPLVCKLVCWCGSSMRVKFDDDNELREFVLAHGGKESASSPNAIIEQLRQECREIDNQLGAGDGEQEDQQEAQRAEGS